jgi:aldose sugar dehydrogenase
MIHILFSNEYRLNSDNKIPTYIGTPLRRSRFLLYIISITIMILILYPMVINLHEPLTVFTPMYGQVQEPIINSSNLRAKIVYSGIGFPTSMAFLGANDILVLEKNEGTVRRIINGSMLPEPLLDVNVATMQERGMLGMAIAKHEKAVKPHYIFLYFTESETYDGDDAKEGKNPLGARLYRYDLEDNNKMSNPNLLLDLQVSNQQGPIHNGGKIVIGPDDNVYLVTGDFGNSVRTRAQNNNDENNTNGYNLPDGTSGILRIDQDGQAIEGILGEDDPLNKYYAYGIRNSFGIDFDPITGKLWDTENGPTFGDEINLVEAGFNSGWSKIQGIWEVNNSNWILPVSNSIHSTNVTIDFGGKGKYSEPEFTWKQSVGLTAIKFFNSDKLGKEYENDMFVADIVNGNIYHFELNETRNGLLLDGSLSDRVLDTKEENQGALFASGFVGITDMQVGPDGYLYVLAIQGNYYYEQGNPNSKGTIYRIEPTNNAENLR